MPSRTGFEARCVCGTCNEEILLFGDAFDVQRLRSHSGKCPGTIAVRSVSIDPGASPSEAYNLGVRGWPFVDLARATFKNDRGRERSNGVTLANCIRRFS